ncbi:MAG: adenylosuccinate lyase, partial [Candidatus Thermoplasmatota archaeon]
LPAWENAIQWHERDLCNSSSERFIIPHSLILTDWIVYKMREVFSKLKVNTSKMKENIEISKGTILSEAIMMKLVEKGMGRQEAHEMMRKYAMEAREKNAELKEVVSREIAEIIDEIGEYYGNAEKLVDFTLEKIRKEFPDIAL